MTFDSFAQRARLRADRVPLGILFMLGATVMFAVSSALSKWQVAEYSFVEVLFFRATASLFTCAALILPRTGLAVLRTERLRDHLGRSATQAVAQIIAFGLMPLAGAVAINFSSPLFATLFAALWLKEKVGLARICALMAGFVGVLLVAAPGADSFPIGAMFALANAVLFGSVTAAVRGMTTTKSAETLTMYQMIFLTLFFALPLPFFFAWPTMSDAAAMIGNGVINAIGQYWWTRALSLAPLPLSAHSITSCSSGRPRSVLRSGATCPTLALLAGSAMVGRSGLFLLWHEDKQETCRRGLEFKEKSMSLNIRRVVTGHDQGRAKVLIDETVTNVSRNALARFKASSGRARAFPSTTMTSSIHQARKSAPQLPTAQYSGSSSFAPASRPAIIVPIRLTMRSSCPAKSTWTSTA